jgi:hypothetical protein
MEHVAVAIGEWNYTNAFFLYFVAVAVPMGGWIYFSVEGLHHMTSADVPRPLGLWVAYRIVALSVEAVIAAWLVPVMHHENMLPWTVAAVLFAQSAYFTSKARRQFLDWIAERRDMFGNK